MSWLNYLMEIFSNREALAPRPPLKTCSHCGSKVEYLQLHPECRSSFWGAMVCGNCSWEISKKMRDAQWERRQALLEKQKKPTEFFVEEEL